MLIGTCLFIILIMFALVKFFEHTGQEKLHADIYMLVEQKDYHSYRKAIRIFTDNPSQKVCTDEMKSIILSNYKSLLDFYAGEAQSFEKQHKYKEAIKYYNLILDKPPPDEIFDKFGIDMSAFLTQMYKARKNIYEKARAEPDKPIKPKTDEPGLTYENYMKLRNGMSLAEAIVILGFDYKQTSGASVFEQYLWEDGWKMIVATFQDGKLISKSQSGL